MELYDIHSHFLPGIDDGSKNLEMTFGILRECVKQNITHIIATPHYYRTQPIEDFLTARNGAYSAVVTAMSADAAAPDSSVPAEAGPAEIAWPQIILGAEVAYSEYLLNDDNLPKLCIGNTNYLLLEMPFRRWTEKDLAGVETIIRYYGIRPIIAHIERFYQFHNRRAIAKLLTMPVEVQINAEFVLSDFRKAKHLIKKGNVQYLGSDCHNLTSRRQNLRAAADLLEDKGLSEELIQIERNSRKLFKTGV